MRGTISTFILLTIFGYSSFAQNPDLQWIDGVGGEQNCTSAAIKSDNLGNCYLLGNYKGIINFPIASGNFPLESEGVLEDIFLCKSDSLGNFIWAEKIGGYSQDKAADIAIDNAGYVYFFGIFNAMADIEPGPGQNIIIANGSDDLFLVKKDFAGNNIWSKRFGGIGIESAVSIGIDMNSNIYLGGGVVGLSDLIPTPIIDTIGVIGSSDIIVVKLNSQGEFQWVNNIGGPSHDFLMDMHVDNAGNIYCTGTFNDSASFDHGAGGNMIYSNGNLDIFICKYNTNGSLVWANSIGGVYNDEVAGMAFTEDEGLIITGLFLDTIDFDPGAGIFELTGAGQYNRGNYFCKLDTSGSFVWARQIGGKSSYRIHAIDSDNNGDFYITGFFHDSLDLDPGNGVFVFDTLGNTDILIAKYNDNGDFSWAQNFGAPGYNVEGNQLDIDPHGNVYLANFYTIYHSQDSVFMGVPALGVHHILMLRLAQLDYLGSKQNVSHQQYINLYQNYPNPFKGQTEISFYLPTSDFIELSVYDAKGILTTQLYRGVLDAGTHSMELQLSSETKGMYYYQLKTSKGSLMRKMIKF